MNFNQEVLALVKKIPEGRVTTYKIISEKLGTKAYRAVGTALRKNKELITIPCHRVVKSNGRIGGFAKRQKVKREMLESERICINNKGIIENFKKIQFHF